LNIPQAKAKPGSAKKQAKAVTKLDSNADTSQESPKKAKGKPSFRLPFAKGRGEF